MQKITPNLWFDKEAKQAAEFYVSIFKNSEIKSILSIHDTPSGTVDNISVILFEQEFNFLNAGPYFKFNPSVSFLLTCLTKGEVGNLWEKLSDGGMVLMELGEYPFSEKYGWVQDKFGLSWQLIFVKDSEHEQRITPKLMFVGDACGKAEEAINFYTSTFHDAKIEDVLRYKENELPDKKGTIKTANFTVEGYKFSIMDSAYEHNFAFNEAISFIVNCENQQEVDYYWERLSAVPEAEQCGWLKDKFGLSWQIVPKILNELLEDKDEKKRTRVTKTFLKMKKFDIKTLKQAYSGKSLS